MTRWKITIEYDGAGFVGWQRQDNGLSVQQALEEAVFAFTHERPSVFGAGRTDSGVHALAQVAHFDIEKEFDAGTIRGALNYHCKGRKLAVLAAATVPDDFHARFSAVSRHYLYRILNRPAPPVLDRERVWHVPAALDADAMHEAARVLLGKHDFSSFRAAACQAETALKTLDALEIHRIAEEIHVTASSRSFLHNQVRIICGTLKLVGEGRWSAADLGRALDARDRKAAGPTAPACGLYLTRVEY